MARGDTVVLATSAAVTASGKRGNVLKVGVAAGADAASCTIKDGGTSGTIKWVVKAPIGEYREVTFEGGLDCATDNYATITGTTPSVSILYEQTE